MAGGVYLLHFLEPIGNPHNRRAMASHYIGHAERFAVRIAEHTSGQGAAIMRAVWAAGVGFVLAETWPGASRTFERRLKRQHNAPRLCPVCAEVRHAERGVP
jgi:putative endonuclease